MQQNPPPGNSKQADTTGIPFVSFAATQVIADDPSSSSVFDWSDLLDFHLDESFNISFPQPETGQSQPSEILGRVRKRDPRLVCSNFLAGKIPCACPELDEMLEGEEEEESALPGKKRPRAVRVPAGIVVRCQVPGCEADISQLKGYHKRHRVCLQCANASVVVLDEVSKRYCQQCGKFHILSAFDEGKRSCRRKLEQHNRRRRKANDSKEDTEKETQQIILTDDVSGDDTAGKDGTSISCQNEEYEALPELDGHVSTTCSTTHSQSLQSDSFVSFAPTKEKRNPKVKQSLSFRDNKSTFSSLCPSSRISFKLYNWNPAEFPRRLRHQIFHWLASMPVELEEYIRPGCTILTAFIAMPKPMWIKLFEEPAPCIKDLISPHESMLFGRGTLLVYLNDMVYRVTKDANSIVKIEMKDRAPKLHYIYPTCFEAGKPMEFVACGSDLLQPKFRFLVSFAGRYLSSNISITSEHCEKGGTKSSDHQLLKIRVPQAKMNLLGPAFIEVENESGLSNFIPILVGDREICEEMEVLLQKFDATLSFKELQLSCLGPDCEVLASRRAQFSEFVLDVAWLLRNPISGQPSTSSSLLRFNHLLEFLIEKESCVILERVFCSLKSVLDNNSVTGISDADMSLLQKNMDTAQNVLDLKLQQNDFLVTPTSDGTLYGQSSQNHNRLVGPAMNLVVH
ncbi:squamosa promoter-binding-like protein 7 isoform X2 [Primulina eburnea]|uniref:squamosa promoter-binding-like protein 7 isoform X2 n=1 Tax=Primulina eburnea TaxID=1245227 RepID=UPI003C6BDC66